MTKKTVLQIINEVEKKMGFTPSQSLVQRRTTTVYLQLLNEVITIIDNHGDWMERYDEIVTFASAGVLQYEIPVSAPIKRVQEVRFEGRVPKLMITDHSQLRSLISLGNTGQPNQYNVFGTDNNGNPIIRVYPTPNETFNNKKITFVVYNKTPNYTTNDAAMVPPFSANLLIKGLYFKALLEANDGGENPATEQAGREFTLELNEELNKYTNDTDDDIQFNPCGRGY